jgi:3-oxoacyl-[acyl-carrier protein] reductase
MDKAQSYTLINGASGGLGLKLAEEFLKSGKRNIICHYNSNSTALESLFKSFDLDSRDHLFQANLSKEEEVLKMGKSLREKGIFVKDLINLFGASNNSMSWKLSLNDFNKVIEANLTATFLTCREFIPDMRQTHMGSIINISSIVGSTGVAGASHYCAAKAGIDGFSRSLALELASKKVKVNVIALGYFDYGIIREISDEFKAAVKNAIPVKQLGQISDLYSMVKYLTADDCGFLTGQILHLNGGQYLG